MGAVVREVARLYRAELRLRSSQYLLCQLHANRVLDCTTTAYYSHNFWLTDIILHGSGGEGNVLAVKFSII
jgi:hypothetical protein